jgi:hypothetical protein
MTYPIHNAVCISVFGPNNSGVCHRPTAGAPCQRAAFYGVGGWNVCADHLFETVGFCLGLPQSTGATWHMPEA